MLWNCEASLGVCAELKNPLQKWWCQERSFFDIWDDMVSNLQRNYLEEAATIARRIWFRKNKFVFKNKFSHPSLLVSEAIIEV